MEKFMVVRVCNGGARARKTVVVQKTRARFIYLFEKKWLKNCEFVKNRSIMCFSTV